MRTFYKLLASIYLFGSGLQLYAQTTISGTVTDDAGAPASFTNVIILTSQDSSFVDGAITDDDGEFEIQTDAKAGSYFLKATSIGYRDQYTDGFTLIVGQSQNVGELTFAESAFQLETATVVAEKPLFVRQLDRTIVNVADQPTAIGQTALEVLERSPGVAVDRIGGNVSMLGKDGVQVMINGRLNYMPADALLAYLAGIPASDIIRLELITTPPANLDAEGNAGYIDIVLRRLPDEGLRGTYALTGGLASPRNGNAGEVAQGNVSATYRKGITSLFGGLSFNRNGVPEQSYLRRTVGEGNVEDRTNLAFERDPTRNVLNARFGADFALNESTTLGFLASGYTNQYDMSGVQRNIYGFGVSTDTLLITKLQEENNWLHFQSGVSLTKQLVDGGRISGGVDYLFYNNSNPIDYNLAYQSLDESIAFRENQLGSTKDSPFGIVVGKVDYLRPIGNSDGEFAIGAKLVIADFENDVALKREDVIDPAFSTASTLNESVSAAYAQYKASAKGFEYQVGLRYELTDTELDELSAGKLVDRNYGQLFPNVSVAFQATKRIKITAGFSRRINRPAFTQLAPFVVFLDPRTSFGGNPALQPSISNNLEIGASRGGWSLQLAYAVVDSAIASFQPVFDSHLGTQIIRPLNLREQTLYSATLGIPIRITSWWKGRLNATFTQQETVSLVDGADLTRTQGTFRLAGGQNFSLPNDFSLSLSGFYQGRNLNGYVNALPLGALNIALQKKLAAGRLTFTVDDVLNTLEFRNETLILDQNFVSERGFDFSRPTFKITWSAAFGNGRVEDANRDSAAEERGRVR